MDYLFYVGIIIPTLITIALFLIFIYCWFLQKARKEVLTKKYDPHGKMRRLGISMDPPPPPIFCRFEDSLLLHNGEDNIAYDVSRSPSTEQDGRGRPMYHTYHDSGISAGLSPSQESEPRPGLAYRTCPDSGISGFGTQPSQCAQHACRGFCHLEDQIQQHPQQMQLYGDQIQIHPQRLQQQPQLPLAVLHHNLVQASVHPTHGVCYGDDMTHPQSPQHYNPLPLSSHYDERQMNMVTHMHAPPRLSTQTAPPMSSYHDSPEHQVHHSHEQACYNGNQIPTDHHQVNASLGGYSPFSRQGQSINVASTSSELQGSNRITSPPSSTHFHPQTNHPPDASNAQYHKEASPLSSTTTKPLRHSYRDSGVSETGQSNINSADRPDSQASQSSTTDSEDSGFRSSHCAVHQNGKLGKHGNHLLKPLRRTKNNKGKNKPPRTSTSNGNDSQFNGATALITLNPQNLPTSLDNANVVQSTALMDVELAHRPSRVLQQNPNITNSGPGDVTPKSSPVSTQAGVPLTYSDGSPIRNTNSQHSPLRENWPPQSTNDKETTIKQNIDLNDISTHLSWKYLQDMSPSSNGPNSGSPNGAVMLQSCHKGLVPGKMKQINTEQHMEMFGYSVV